MPSQSQKHLTTGSECPPSPPGTLRLYSNIICPYAQRARIVLAHKNIPYETVNIHLRQKPEWFSDLNPMGMIPVLQKDGVVLYESLVICDYLDEVYPEEKVVPVDPVQKAKDRMFMERYSKVTKYYGILVDNAPDILKGYSMIEEELKQRKTKFIGGDKPMLVDFVIWTHLERMLAFSKVMPELEINRNSHPLLKAWIEAIQTVPAIQATLLSGDVHMEFNNKNRGENPDYDFALKE